MVVMVATGCGYRFAGEAIDLPGGVQKVRVELFANRTQEPYLDTLATGSVIERLMRLHNVEIVESPDAADAVLDGEVLQYSISASAYDAGDAIQSYRVTMRVAATLTRVSDGRFLWRGEAVRFEDFVSAGVDITTQEGLESEARKRAADRIAEDLSWQMATGFGAPE